MGTSFQNDPRTEELLLRAAAGDQKAIGELFEAHRERLHRMVSLRMDRRLQGRIGASDVIQEAYLVAMRRLPEYLRELPAPFFLWLRFLTGQKLLTLHEHHLAKMRDPRKEVFLHQGALPEASSEAMAARLIGRRTSPSEAAIRAELKVRIQEALNRMDPIDREILALCHFEHLTSPEAAQVLGIQEEAARQRHARALIRLRGILKGMPGGLEGLWK